jgi:hypothetical protein
MVQFSAANVCKCSIIETLIKFLFSLSHTYNLLLVNEQAAYGIEMQPKQKSQRRRGTLENHDKPQRKTSSALLQDIIEKW